MHRGNVPVGEKILLECLGDMKENVEKIREGLENVNRDRL